MKGLVYTAIFGGRDQLRPLLVPEADVDYVAYVDREYPKASGWRQKIMAPIHGSPRLDSRFHKIFMPAFGESLYDWMLWCDGSHQPKVPLRKLIEETWLKDADIALHKHPARNCAYAEAKECARIKKCTGANADSIMDRMLAEGYPREHGLHATPTLVRKVNEKTAAHAKLWWDCVKRNCVRDQTSFDYAAWKTGAKVFTIPGHCYESPRFKYFGGH